MSGILGIIGAKAPAGASRAVLDSIDRLRIDETALLEIEGGFMAAAALKNAALRGPRSYRDERFTACLCGDIVGCAEVPWERIIEPFRRGAADAFPDFAGFFALSVFDARERVLFLVSDPFSFHPLYYRVTGASLHFSTSVATFARLDDPPGFDVRWLYEWLYFSNAMLDTTPLVDVRRMPPATVLRYEADRGRLVSRRYGRSYRRAAKPLTGKRAVERAVAVFRERVPAYWAGVGTFAHAVTAGFDTRTVLAFLRGEAADRAVTYTYGTPGCLDLVQGRAIAERMHLAHREVPFDEAFLAELPRLVRETVFLSGGLENVNRAYLVHVYRTLTDNGAAVPAVVSGVGADALFRGHIPVPNGISVDLERCFFTGRRVVSEAFFRELFGARYGDFRAHIEAALDRFNETYGEFGAIDTYVAYLVYENLPKYFGGENAIAGNFTTLRMPFYDPEILQLVFDLDLSVFRFVRFASEDLYRENYLQAGLIASNADLARVPVRGMPLRSFSSGNKMLYQLNRLLYRGPGKLASSVRARRMPVLDDWRAWYRTALRGELDGLFGAGAGLAEYVDLPAVGELRARESIHWVKLLATAEIVLRLSRNGWRSGGPEPGAARGR